jgi:hypothetical protein
MTRTLNQYFDKLFDALNIKYCSFKLILPEKDINEWTVGDSGNEFGIKTKLQIYNQQSLGNLL